MSDLIDRQQAIDAIDRIWSFSGSHYLLMAMAQVQELPTAKRQIMDIIQKFHDYQVEWLKSHHDITFDDYVEDSIIHFLHDTANCYMMEVNNE